MTQRLEIFYRDERDECIAEAINTEGTFDECRIIVPKHIDMTIDFRLETDTVNSSLIIIEDIETGKEVYKVTLSNESGKSIAQAYIPADPESNKEKRYILNITNSNSFKCKVKSRNNYEMRFEDNYIDEDYNDITAHLKFFTTPLKDKDVVLLRSRKGTYINTPHGTGPFAQMIDKANPDPRISHEGWIIERPSSSGPVNHGDAVFIKSRKNHYVNSDGKVDSLVLIKQDPNTEICNSDEIWFLELIVIEPENLCYL